LNSGFVCDAQSRFFVSAPLSSKHTTEKPLDRVPRWLAHFGLHMAIGLERERYAGVTKHLTHDEWLHAFEEQQGRRRVPKIMWSDIRQLRPLDDRDVLLLAEVDF
jgi:hypothetical protein